MQITVISTLTSYKLNIFARRTTITLANKEQYFKIPVTLLFGCIDIVAIELMGVDVLMFAIFTCESSVTLSTALA